MATDKQIQAAKQNIKKAQQTPRSQRQKEASRENVKKAQEARRHTSM